MFGSESTEKHGRRTDNREQYLQNKLANSGFWRPGPQGLTDGVPEKGVLKQSEQRTQVFFDERGWKS